MSAPKIALITGANSGIGFAIAKTLVAAPEGYRVILAGRSATKLDAAISDIKASHPVTSELSSLVLDVTNSASIKDAVETFQRNFEQLDVLVNNAGIAPYGPDTETMFRETLTTNVTGPALVSEAFRPLLLKSEAPYSVYIGSETSSLEKITNPKSYLYNTTSGSNIYRASKAALNMLAMHEKLKFADTPLKVRIMCPGLVVSNLRGTNEDARQAGGRAGDPDVSAKLLLSIIRGEREDEADTLIQSQGHAEW